MKKFLTFLLFLLLNFILVTNVNAYTNEDGQVVEELDRGETVEFYPVEFSDGTKGAWGQGKWKFYENSEKEDIPGGMSNYDIAKKVDESAVLYAKTDVHGRHSYYPTVNSLVGFTVDKKALDLRPYFRFGIYDFHTDGMQDTVWLQKANIAGLGIEAIALNNEGKEIYNDGIPDDMDFYIRKIDSNGNIEECNDNSPTCANGERLIKITETLGEGGRKILTSTNPYLKRNLGNGLLNTLANRNDGFTPAIYLLKSDIDKTMDYEFTLTEGVDKPRKEQGKRFVIRVFPVYAIKDGKFEYDSGNGDGVKFKKMVEVAYMADKKLGKVARVGTWENEINGKDTTTVNRVNIGGDTNCNGLVCKFYRLYDSNDPALQNVDSPAYQGTITSFVNYWAFASPDTIKNGIYTPDFDFDLFVSALKAFEMPDGDNSPYTEKEVYKMTAEILNHFGAFNSVQTSKGALLTDDHGRPKLEITLNKFRKFFDRKVSAKNRRNLGQFLFSSSGTSREKELTVAYQKMKLLKGTRNMMLLTIDLDNIQSVRSISDSDNQDKAKPQVNQSFAFFDIGKDNYQKFREKVNTSRELKNNGKTEEAKYLLEEAGDELLGKKAIMSVLLADLEGGNKQNFNNKWQEIKYVAQILGNKLGDFEGAKKSKGIGDRDRPGLILTEEEKMLYGQYMGFNDPSNEIVSNSHIISLNNMYTGKDNKALPFTKKIKDNAKNIIGNRDFFSSFLDIIDNDSTRDDTLIYDKDKATPDSIFMHGNSSGYNTLRKWGIGFARINVSDLIVTRENRNEFLECNVDVNSPEAIEDPVGQNCRLKKDYVFLFSQAYITDSNAWAYATNAERFGDSEPEASDGDLVIDLGLENNFCTFRKPTGSQNDPKSKYKLLNADPECKDLYVKENYTKTQDKFLDKFNFNNGKKVPNGAIKNPLTPLQPGQKGFLEVNDTNLCDLAFVGKVSATNLDLLKRKIKGLELKLDKDIKNVEFLKVNSLNDIDAGAKTVKFSSKPIDEILDPTNPITAKLGILSKTYGLPTSNSIEDYGKIKIDYCENGLEEDGDSKEKDIYVDGKLKDKEQKPCGYSFEFAFRPISQTCTPWDGISYKQYSDTDKLTIGEGKETEVTLPKKNPDDPNEEPVKVKVKDYSSKKIGVKELFIGGGQSGEKMKFEDKFTNFGFIVNKVEAEKKVTDGSNPSLTPSEPVFETVSPIGKKVVYGGIGSNFDIVPSLKVTIESCAPDCKEFKTPTGPGLTELTEVTPPDNFDVEKPNPKAEGKVMVNVCLENVDPAKKPLFNTRITKMEGMYLIGVPNEGITNETLLDINVKDRNPEGRLNYGEKFCKWKELKTKYFPPKIKPRVKFSGTAEFKEPSDEGKIVETKDSTRTVGWKVNYDYQLYPDCIGDGEGSSSSNGGVIRLCPKNPVNPPNNGNGTPPVDPNDPNNPNNPNGDQVCLARGGFSEFGGKIYNMSTTDKITDVEIAFKPDNLLYVESSKDMYQVKEGDRDYRNVFGDNQPYWVKKIDVIEKASEGIAYDIILGAKTGIPEGTLTINELKLRYKYNGNLKEKLWNNSTYTYKKICDDYLDNKDFVTIEIPKVPIGTNPPVDLEDPSCGDPANPNCPKEPDEDGNRPFNEIPSDDIPKNGGKIKNPPTGGENNGGSKVECNGKLCVQYPGTSNDGTPIKNIKTKTCALYNPTGIDGIGEKYGESRHNKDVENKLPKDNATVRTVKLNYFRVDSDEDAKNVNFKRLTWNYNGQFFRWDGREQDYYKDYTSGPRNIYENDYRAVYQKSYIDYKVILPCELKLANEYIGSNDPGDERGTAKVIEIKEIKGKKSGRNLNQKECTQKEITIRQFLKNKGDTYNKDYYETNVFDTYVDETSKRIEGVTFPYDRAKAHQRVWRYITFNVTPDQTNGVQKIDSIRDRQDPEKYIKAIADLKTDRVYRQVVDEGYTQPGKKIGGGGCSNKYGWEYECQRRCNKKRCWWVTIGIRPLDYQRDHILENTRKQLTFEARGQVTSYDGTSGFVQEDTVGQGEVDSNIVYGTYKGEVNGKQRIWATALIDICNPGAGLCILGDAYSKGGIDMTASQYSGKKAIEGTMFSGGAIKTNENRDNVDKKFSNSYLSVFEDPTGSIKDKYSHPEEYCDYIDRNGKHNPTLDANGNCKTTYFEDLKTGKKGPVKKISGIKWTRNFNLSDPVNPTHNSEIENYKNGGNDTVWVSEGDLILGDNPKHWLKIRGKGTVYIEGDLYINSNTYYEIEKVNDINDRWRLTSALFVVKGNVIIGPDVTNVAGIIAAMGKNSTLYTCGKESGGNECTSRRPLLMQQVTSRNVSFDRKASNEPLRIKSTDYQLIENKDGCFGLTNKDRFKRPECFVDRCIEINDPNQDGGDKCFFEIESVSSSECFINHLNNQINPPSGVLQGNFGGFKRIEIAPGNKAADKGYYDIFR